MRLSILRVLALLLIFPIAALAPAGCTTPDGRAGTISQTLDEKALYTVELAYAGGLASVEAAVDAGALRGEDAERAGAILDQTNSAIIIARRAYAAGETVQAVAAVRGAFRALGDLRALVPPHFTPD